MPDLLRHKESGRRAQASKRTVEGVIGQGGNGFKLAEV